MAQQFKRHIDCENFAPVDVAKGICRVTNEMVLIDSQVCANFEQIPKCSLCASFKNPDKDGIGICKGLNKEYWVDGNYNASVCEGYLKGLS